MSTVKRTLIAAAAAAVSVGGIFVFLGVYPIPAIGRAFAAVGFPLAYLIVAATPDSFLREVAPQGGPDAVGWAVAISTLLTWFVLLFALWFVVIGRMRSNPAFESGPPSAAAQCER